MTDQKPRGRPKGQGTAKVLTVREHFLCSPAQDARAKERAARKGMTFGEYLRWLIDNDQEEERTQ